MLEHLPALQIVVPLMAAPLAIVLRQRHVVTAFALAITWLTLAMSVTLLGRVLDGGPISYALGGWVAPWGIEYRIDVLNGFVLCFVSGIGALVLSFAPRSLTREIPLERHYLFLSAYLLCLTGLLGIAITGDMFNVFVFLEVSSLSSYIMISMGSTRRALTASFHYLVMGTLGATFLLIGIGLTYSMTGTLNMADAAARVQDALDTRTMLVAFAFVTVGVGLKMALFPLHSWLPNAYAFAPSVVTAFLAATATKVSVYVLLRFAFTIFGRSFAFETLPLGHILLPLSIIAIFVTSTVAIFQRNVKRMLAYSSVAQVGYMALGISLASVSGLTAGIVHLFNHALMKGGLFLAMGCVFWRLDSVELSDMRGVGRTMPVTMLAWVIGGLGLIGVPLTCGFVSKWALISATLERGTWLVAALILLSSLLALVYVWRVVEVAYFQAPPDGRTETREAPWAMLIPTWILIGLTIYFGLSTSMSLDVARRAAEALLGSAS